MGWIDFILNVAGLLLWLNWRSMGFAPVPASAKNPLLRTLKRPEVRRGKRWFYLIGLGALLLFRPVIYRHVGSALDWTPHLQLNVLSLPFRSDLPDRMLWYSLLSFAMAFFLFYSWLLLLSVINGAETESDALQKLVSLHLGWIDRLPAYAKIVLPELAACLLWAALAPLFAKAGILPTPASAAQTWEQGLVLGLVTFLAWKWLLVGILLLHLLNSYVYLGESPLLNFVTIAARHLLKPLQPLRLQVQKVDFAPLVGVGLVLLLEYLGSRLLSGLYDRLSL